LAASRQLLLVADKQEEDYTFTAIHDEAKLARYVELAGPAIRTAGDTFLARDNPVHVLEGRPRCAPHSYASTAPKWPSSVSAQLRTSRRSRELPALLAVDAVVALDGDTMTFVDLVRMLRTFATSAFRLETRQLYATAEEAAAFAGWRECEAIPDASEPLISGWTGIVRAHVEAGAVMRRVHVVKRPMTEYVRFELALQREYSVPAGE
jgi:Domain of unknown function (DUF1330)